MPEPILDIRQVERRYSLRQGVLGLQRSTVTAVAGVSLAVQPGETLGLVGESGCGKSTLARLALGLERPDAGDIRVAGTSLLPRPPRDLHRRVQMVFQDPYASLNPRRSVGATIAEPLVIAGMPAGQRRQRVQELLDLVGLRPEHAARYPHEFSGGQRQRIAIARGLAPSPALLVLDEPVSALDVSIQAQIIGLLEDLQARLQLTYLFISHDLAVVEHLCQRVAVMYLGRIMELGPREAVFNNPAHPYTRTLLAAVPEPDPRRAVSPAQAVAAERQRIASGANGCAFAPRCALAEERCQQAIPPLRQVGPDHFAACGAS